MLFAIVDYINYRRGYGRYSKEAIEARGGVLATAENYSADKLPIPGRIIIVHTRNSFLAWLVMYFTNSVWSHTVMALDNGEVSDLTLQGHFAHPFADLLNDVDYLVVASGPPMTAEQQRDLVASARSMVGSVNFSYSTALLMGLRALVGRDAKNYRIQLSVDLLAILLAIAFVGRRSKVLVTECAILSAVYIALVVRNAGHREDERAGRIGPGW